MTNNMNITFEQSDDPQACQTNETVYLQYSRDPVRTPFQWDDTDSAGFSTNLTTWLPIHKDYKTTNLKIQKEADKSTFKLYKKLIELRKASHVLQMGNYSTVALSTNLFGFTRTMEGEKSIAVFVNLGAAAIKGNLSALMGNDYASGLKGQVFVVNSNSKLEIGDWIENLEEIDIAQYEALVLEVSSATKLAISLLMIVCSLFKFIF